MNWLARTWADLKSWILPASEASDKGRHSLKLNFGVEQH